MDINEEEASRTEKESNATYFVRVACNWISKIDTWTKVNQRDREGEVPDYQSSIRRIFFLTRARASHAKFRSTSAAFHLSNRVHSLITREGTLLATFLHRIFFFYLFFCIFLFSFSSSSSFHSSFYNVFSPALPLVFIGETLNDTFSIREK